MDQVGKRMHSIANDMQDRADKIWIALHRPDCTAGGAIIYFIHMCTIIETTRMVLQNLGQKCLYHAALSVQCTKAPHLRALQLCKLAEYHTFWVRPNRDQAVNSESVYAHSFQRDSDIRALRKMRNRVCGLAMALVLGSQCTLAFNTHAFFPSTGRATASLALHGASKKLGAASPALAGGRPSMRPLARNNGVNSPNMLFARK